MTRTIIRFGWKAATVWMIALGLWYGPADTAGSLDAYPAVKRLVEMLDQQTLLTAALLLCGLYILWMDARPYVQRWFGRVNAYPLSLVGQNQSIICYSMVISNSDDEFSPQRRVFREIHQIAVSNSWKNARTIRNLQLIFWLGGSEYILKPSKVGADAVDLRPGATALFDIGFRYTDEPPDEIRRGVEKVPNTDFAFIQRTGAPETFFFSTTEGGHMGLVLDPQRGKMKFQIPVHFIGDDVPSVIALVTGTQENSDQFSLKFEYIS